MRLGTKRPFSFELIISSRDGGSGRSPRVKKVGTSGVSVRFWRASNSEASRTDGKRSPTIKTRSNGPFLALIAAILEKRAEREAEAEHSPPRTRL